VQEDHVQHDERPGCGPLVQGDSQPVQLVRGRHRCVRVERRPGAAHDARQRREPAAAACTTTQHTLVDSASSTALVTKVGGTASCKRAALLSPTFVERDTHDLS
jgi:hypothetical protein